LDWEKAMLEAKVNNRTRNVFINPPSGLIKKSIR
jgi:hypothetical protein